MALQGAYKQFLAAPNPTFLAEDASLHYITTLITLNGSSEILKHLKAQDHELKKKEEKFIDAVEGTNALAVEVHTTLEFLTGGGSYLPSLDDNFLADRTVTLPIVCVSSQCPWASANRSADPHCYLRCERKDPTSSTKLGSGFSTKAD
jgi:hypothetical protein